MNFTSTFRAALVFAGKLFFSTLAVCSMVSSAAAQLSEFINEIHYDNTGTDSGEAIEIAGAAGTDLTGWSIVRYNGSNGLVYGTSVLSGSIPNLQGGFGAVFVEFPSNGVQNGSPDGIALVDDSNAVIQFLSYEGAFTAVDGPAAGMMSTDIGVTETSSTPIGSSLQLTGAGSIYENFVWAGPQPNTFGAVNTGQTFGGGEPPAPILVINEIDYDQPSTDTAEFVEIINNGGASANLAGWTLRLFNGSGGGSALYKTVDLAGFALAAGEYLVVCANAATVSNCDIDTSPDTNLIQNGSPDAAALYLDEVLMDTVSYEGDTAAPYTEGSGIGLADTGVGSISRCPDGSDTNQNNADFKFAATVTPGAENSCNEAQEVKIHEVQGDGASSPMVGALVIIEGIVVGDFQDGVGSNGDLNGFFVQEEDADTDADPLTSEGIFVFNGSSPAVDVAIGDLVSVKGAISEFNGLTEITSFTDVVVISSGNALPTAGSPTLPVTSQDDFEHYEGMLVTFSQSLVIADYFNYDRFGEISLSSERHLTPTAEFEPGADAILAGQNNQLDMIILDDGRTAQNPDPAIHPDGNVFDLTNLFRGGDTLQNVTGVINYSFGVYRIQPTQGAGHSNDNPRTAQPDDVGANFKVASFNVLNYFTTLDDGAGSICGPLMNQGCRGADDADEFTRQRDKIIAALGAIDADVVGLIEIENQPADVPTADLVAGLNDVVGAGTYSYIETGPIGTDAIRVAVIYKPATTSPVGSYAVLDESVDSRFLDNLNRPALAQSFIDNSTGGVFTVAVNHLKSKGSNCNAVGDFDTGEGADSCNLTRTAAAEALVDWLATDPTSSGDDDFLIIGDLNSYDKEDPIDAIVAGGYVDLLYSFQGEDAYSYVFGAQTGYLDHALANASLDPEVTGTTAWHINSDEPDLIDYDTSFKGPNQDAIYAPDPYRSSDHDPVIIGLDVCDEIAPMFDNVSVTPNVLWPANHKYVDVMATVNVSDNFDADPTVTLVSVTSNEEDNGNGDGNTDDDIVIVDDFHIKLRAERSGGGSGRTYTITYLVTDDCGNSTTTSVTVVVPHNQGKGK